MNISKDKFDVFLLAKTRHHNLDDFQSQVVYHVSFSCCILSKSMFTKVMYAYL